MTSPPNPSNLLTKFEQETMREPYREYYATKRNNFFASVQGFRPLWDCFMLANDIWIREFADMRTVLDPSRMFPLNLFMNAHAKMLVSMELAFSGCIPEAHSILRDAIESVAHGHRLFSDPELQKIWVQRNDDDAATDAFRDAFWHSKAEKLFDGIPELHKLWSQFSDSGSHTNINSILLRFVVQESSTHVEWKMNYTGVEKDIWIKVLFEMLLVFHLMEKVFHKDCEGRLKLDTDLNRLRTKFQRDKEALRCQIIAAFKIPPPTEAK